MSTLCEEAIRLLDAYCAALTAFHGAREPFLRGLEPGDSEWLSCVLNRDRAFRKLVAARKKYLTHSDRHGCRRTGVLKAAG